MVLYSIGFIDYTNDFFSTSPELYSNLDTAIKIIMKKNITKDNIDLVKKQYDDISSINNNLILE